jgi:hypothetical protein
MKLSLLVCIALFSCSLSVFSQERGSDASTQSQTWPFGKSEQKASRLLEKGGMGVSSSSPGIIGGDARTTNDKKDEPLREKLGAAFIVTLSNGNALPYQVYLSKRRLYQVSFETGVDEPDPQDGKNFFSPFFDDYREDIFRRQCEYAKSLNLPKEHGYPGTDCFGKLRLPESDTDPSPILRFSEERLRRQAYKKVQPNFSGIARRTESGGEIALDVVVAESGDVLSVAHRNCRRWLSKPCRTGNLSQ